MPNEWFGCAATTSMDDEVALTFADDPSNVEHPITRVTPFKVNADHPQPIGEQEVRWGRVTVKINLSVLPHRCMVSHRSIRCSNS
jgi:hypothetical protein